MSRPIAFQFYPKDWLTDGNVASMGYAARGVYLQLLCFCWLDESLPADQGALATMLGLPAAKFRLLWPAVSRCFVAREDGRLTNPRLERERAAQRAYREKSAAGGRRSAEVRWGRKGGVTTPISKPVTEPVSKPVTEGQPTGNSPVSSTPVQIQVPPLPPDLDARFARLWDAWPRHRRKNKPDARKAFKAAKVDDALLDAMLAAIAKQRCSIDWVREDGRFIPYPASWIRGRCWEDPVALDPHLARQLLLTDDDDGDWFQECKELHGLQCNGRGAHRIRMDIERWKATHPKKEPEGDK